MSTDRDWMDGRRLCADLDPSEADAIFFPHPNSDALEAKATCRNCLLWRDCRQYARDTKQPFGVWGGETEHERAQAEAAKKYPNRPNMPTHDPRCGEYRGVKAHIARREQLCRPCKDAKAAYERDRNARKRALDEELTA